MVILAITIATFLSTTKIFPYIEFPPSHLSKYCSVFVES